MRHVFRFLLAVGLLSQPLSLLQAQRTTKAGLVEWNMYGGGTFDLPGAAGYAGIFDSRNSANNQQRYEAGRKSQPQVGTGLAVALTKMLWLYADYSYIFPDRSTASVDFLGLTGVTTVNRHYWAGSAGFQLAFPNVQRVTPYLEFGGLILHHSYGTTSRYTNVSGTPFRSLRIAENISGPHVGGGVRIFVGETHGARFSVDGNYLTKALEQQVPSATQTSFPVIFRRGWGRVSVGYFWRFGRH